MPKATPSRPLGRRRILKNATHLSFMLDRSDYDDLNAIAERDMTSIGAVARKLLTDGLKDKKFMREVTAAIKAEKKAISTAKKKTKR
jgi:hypothetical protein